MNHLLEPELEREAHHYSDDREISLGPGTILGLFFVLALICACFFGFGYSVGHRSATSAVPAVIVPATSASSAPKPSAGSFTPPSVTAANALQPGIPADAAVAAAPKTASTQAPTSAAPASGASAAGSFMVQVAAVSSQQIADIEVSALRKDGYAVVVRHEPQDTLLHVQIGPFADKKEAEAMRQRVIADGFNAIVK
jgi:DedD protein